MSILGDSKIDFGRPMGILNLWGGRLTQRLDLRALTVSGIVVLVAIAVALVTLASGEFQIAIPEVIGALFGQATAKVHMVVVEWRLPRTSLALIMGAALGMSGAIFQSLTRNPLGSPDVGVDRGEAEDAHRERHEETRPRIDPEDAGMGERIARARTGCARAR